MVASRARIGVIIPTDTDVDADLWKYIPKNVNVLVSRLRQGVTGIFTPSEIENYGQAKEIIECAKAVKVSRADVIAYACTSGSFRKPGADVEIAKLIEEATDGIPAVTTSFACKQALQRLNARKLAIFSPYPDFLDSLLKRYLTSNGFEIVNMHSLGLTCGSDVCDLAPWELYRWGKKVNTSSADCVFVPCTDVSAAEVIAPLENDLGKPVVTATQATMWKALRMAGVMEAVPNVGKLLELS